MAVPPTARTAAAIVAGLALGFVAAGLATELYEEFVAGAPQYDEEGEFTGLAKGPLWDLQGRLGAATAFLVTGLLLWAAHHRRDRRGGALLAALAVSTPAWYAFYEVDHREALVGVGLALGAAWASLTWSHTRSVRAALAAGVALASAVPLYHLGDFWQGPVATTLLEGVLISGLGVVSLVVFLLVLGRMPTDRLPTAGTIGVLATTVATGVLAALPVFPRFSVEDAWIVFMALAVLAALTALAWTTRRTARGGAGDVGPQ